MLLMTLVGVLACDDGSDVHGGGDTGDARSSAPPPSCRNALALCSTTDDRIYYSIATYVDWDAQRDRQWVEIWRDDERYPPELHEIARFRLEGLELQDGPPPAFGMDPGWDPNISTFYACDAWERPFDPGAWGDATVFWHTQYKDQRECWVAGKHHELGKAMGCLSLHDAPEECIPELR